MEKKYHSYRLTSILLKLLAVLLAILTLLTAAGLCASITTVGGVASALLEDLTRTLSPGQDPGGLAALGSLAGLALGLLFSLGPAILGLACALVFYALAGLLEIQMDSEENSRAALWMLRQQLSGATVRYPAE